VLLNQYNFNDANKYYQNTYIQFKEEPGKLYSFVHADPEFLYAYEITMNDTGNLVVGEFVCIDIKDNYTMDFLLPRRTLVPMPYGVVLVSRHPAKQWKKGIHADNTRLFALKESGDWKGISFSLKPIFTLIKGPIYKTFKEVLALVRSENKLATSYALTPRLSISTNNGQIYLDLTQVGRFDFKTHILACNTIVLKDVIPHIDYIGLEDF
jgi:hypothetical protein